MLFVADSVGMDSVETEAAVSISREELGSVLALRASFHLDLAPELPRAALELANTGGRVVVDCGQTEHLDGCVSRILLAVKLALKQAGGSLRLRGESSEIRKYLGWAGMAAHFPGEESPAITRKRRKRARKPTA